MCTQPERKHEVDDATPILPSETQRLLRVEAQPVSSKQPIENRVDDAPSSAASTVRGYMYMLVSAFCYALVQFFVHVAETSYGFPTASVIIIRAFTSITLTTAYLTYYGLLSGLRLPGAQWIRLGSRGLFGAITAALTFAAGARIDVGTVMTLLYASPAITSLLASVFLHDAFTPMHALTLVVNFVGIYLVSEPLASSSASSAVASSTASSTSGVAFALGAAFSSSIVYTLQRAMGVQVHFVLGVFASGLGYVLVALALSDANAVTQLVTNVPGMCFGLASGIAGFFSQTTLNRGLQLCPAGPAIVVRSTTVPIGIALGLVFLGEVPSLTAVLGVALVMSSVAVIGYVKVRAVRQEEADTNVGEVGKV